jgi:replicative DNA helicase
MQDKLPPKAIKIEEAVLGAILSHKDIILEVLDIITETSFYKEEHKKVFQAAVDLNNESKSIDILTVTYKLQEKGDLELIGGAYFVSQLTNQSSTSSNIQEHSLILKQMEIKREAIRIGMDMMSNGYDNTIQAPDLMEYVLDQAYKLNSFDGGQKLKTNSELILEDKQNIDYANTHKGITGKETGVVAIDRLFGGYQNSDLIIKAARPGVGKTSQMLSEASNMIVNKNDNVLIISIEMTATQLMRKLISIDAEIDLQQMNDGKMTPADWDRYNDTASKYIDSGLIIDDKTNTLNGIRKEAKKLKLKGKLDILFIDYLQLINHKVAAGRSKENEVSEISKALKQLAKELNVPIVCLSQLSRAVETRGGDKIPMLSDLRDSGSIEQDADIVQFLYRPEYYGLNELPDGESAHQVAFMNVAKHRNGTLKDVKMRFIGNFTKFTDWTDGSFNPQDFNKTAMPIGEDFDSEKKTKEDNDIPF